jgi:hypothetical protein
VPDDFAHGWERLAKGKIRNWVMETTRTRGMRSKAEKSNVQCSDGTSLADDEDEGEVLEGGDETLASPDDEDDGEVLEAADKTLASTSTFGSMSFVDGEFVIETLDGDEMVMRLMEDLEMENGENESDTGSDIGGPLDE